MVRSEVGPAGIKALRDQPHVVDTLLRVDTASAGDDSRGPARHQLVLRIVL